MAPLAISYDVFPGEQDKDSQERTNRCAPLASTMSRTFRNQANVKVRGQGQNMTVCS